MNEYTGVITVSFEIKARDKDDLKREIEKKLGKELILEEIEIDSVYNDGQDAYSLADIFYDEVRNEQINSSD